MTLVSLLASMAFAQSVDPSVLTFVGQDKDPQATTNSVGPQADLDSSRYVHKKAAPKTEPAAKSPRRKMANDDPTDNETTEESNTSAQVKASPQPLEKDPAKEIELKTFILGGDHEEVQKYKNLLDGDDLRNNVFELRAGVGYFYNSSVSPFYPRNYTNQSPSGILGTDIWMNPFFGFTGSYRYSYFNNVKDAPGSESSLKDTQQWFDLGFKFRRFSSLSPMASTLTFSIQYSGYDFQSASESNFRPKHSTRALDLGLEFAIPSSKKYSWLFGFGLQPLSSHTESSNASAIQSGTNADSGAIYGFLGGEYKMNRESRGFFKLRFQQYRVQYQGSTSMADPVTGATLSNVSVTNTFVLFDLGIVIGR